jgi:hypothetical protein
MRRLSARDIQALTFVGEGYEVPQYQLQAAIFGDLSPTVASRFVCRAIARGLLIAERVNGIGMNRLRLTAHGVDAVVEAGGNPLRLFAPRRPVADKDWMHTLRINDLRSVLLMQARPPAELRPAWSLQRELTTDAIPDLLAIWRGRKGVDLLLACEIDRGTENLTSVFLPKLRLLSKMLQEAAQDRTAILILSDGERRIRRLRETPESLCRVIVEQLPDELGPKGLASLRSRFEL